MAMYRFAIVATLFAVSANTLAELDRGKGRRTSDRVKEVCESAYREIRDRERDTHVDSDEAIRQLVLAMASADNGKYDTIERVVDLADLEKYRARDELELPKRQPRRKLFPKIRGRLGGSGRGRHSHPHHHHHHFDTDIDIHLDNGQKGDDEYEAEVIPVSRILDAKGKDSVAFSSSKSNSSGVQESSKQIEPSATTEANAVLDAVKTTENSNAETTDGSSVTSGDVQVSSVRPDNKRTGSPSKSRKIHVKRGKRKFRLRSRGKNVPKRHRKLDSKLEEKTSSLTTSSSEHVKLATTTGRSLVAIDPMDEATSKDSVVAEKTLASAPISVVEKSQEGKAKKVMAIVPTSSPPDVSTNKRRQNEASDAEAANADDDKDIGGDSRTTKRLPTRRAGIVIVDEEMDDPRLLRNEPLESGHEPLRLNRNTNINTNVNTNINSNTRAKEVNRGVNGADDPQNIGEYRRPAVWRRPRHYRRFQGNTNENSNVNSWRDADDEMLNGGLSPYRRSMAHLIDEDANVGNSNVNSNFNSNIVGLATKPKLVGRNNARSYWERSATRRPPTRGEAILESLAK